MDTCVACGAELGVGRFCLNCGHRIGAPAPARQEAAVAPTRTTTATAAADEPAEPADGGADATTVLAPVQPPVQAADPTPVPPTSLPDVVHDEPEDDGREDDPVEPQSHASDAPPAPQRRAWDPREDLLPYEEVDDLDGDLPVRGKAWIGWVLAAVLLVALAFVLLDAFGTEGDDVATDRTIDANSSSDSGTASGGDDGAPSGSGKVRNLVRGASFEVPGTAPPTTDFDGNLVAYEASQLGDGNPATAWRTAGDATGQTITITLAEPGVVTRVGLVNGYAKKVAGVNWYPNNRRTTAVQWGFDDGSTVEQVLEERPGMQQRDVPPVETSTVTLTFTAVTPPGTGNLGRDYTALSEIAVKGRRAG